MGCFIQAWRALAVAHSRSYPVMPLADARANAKNALNAAQNGSDPAGEKQAKRATDETVKEFGEKWIESINMAVKSRTAKSYEQLFRLHVVPALGSYILRDVTVRQIKDLLTRKRAGYSKNTVRLIHACVRSLFADALDDGLVSANPAVSLQRHRSNTVSGLSATERVAAIRPFTDDELARLLHVSSANRAYHPLFLTRRAPECGPAKHLRCDGQISILRSAKFLLSARSLTARSEQRKRRRIGALI